VEEVNRELEEQRQQMQEQFRAQQTRLEEFSREMETLRKQARSAQEQLLREIHESSERVRHGAESTGAQLESVKRLFQESGQQFAGELKKELNQARQTVQEARHLWEPLNRQAREFQQQLAALVRELPEARRRLQEVERATGMAQHELDIVLQETTAAETRLAAVREEFQETERHLQQIRSELERVTHDMDETRDQVEEARQQAQEANMVAEVLAAAANLAAEGDNRLGVVVDPGVVVAEVVSGSPASSAGLIVGDVVRSVNDTAVFSGPEVREVIDRHPDGEEVAIHVIREATPQEVKVRLGAAGEGGPGEGRNRLGVVVDPGVVVDQVLLGTPAALAGLLPGDVIRGVNETEIHSGEQLRQAVQQLGSDAEIRLDVRRGGEPMTVKVPREEPLPVP
jgi:hypothetical protein